MADLFVFERPPEAPVFEPTIEEFSDPLAYIAKIRPIAEKSGICRIKPPAKWKPPFAVNVDTFRFTPRIQRLNELEALSRVKLNFLDRLARFWELQGVRLRIPCVDRRHLELHKLHKIVNEQEGGFDKVCRERRWARVALALGICNERAKVLAGQIKFSYERILYPFDLFLKGVTVDPQKVKEYNEERQEKLTPKKTCATVRRHRVPNNVSEQDNPPCDIDYSANKELRKLQFFGAGPKAAVPENKRVKSIRMSSGSSSAGHKMLIGSDKEATSDTSIAEDMAPSEESSGFLSFIENLNCKVCGRGDREDLLLICDGCEAAHHCFCLVPILSDVPRGNWRCPKCVAKACGPSLLEYGFDQSKTRYSLAQFGEKADQFKTDYFNMPIHLVKSEKVEHEFWRLLQALNEDVVVEYGADVHSTECGSGFPTKQQGAEFLSEEDEVYANHGFNLNNLPIVQGSVLRFINVDINGMKRPWCYVGMCFSCFCWHIEDHWSYSVNYLHWGEPKTWYGVPRSNAEALEAAMRRQTPELFEQSADLLHQLTTIMNPNILQREGVHVVRTDQHAGEFVITFPRAYHAGFNQGYNFAEAVNFCPTDWLPIGRECIAHYRDLGRQCVFSHDELVCIMASNVETLDILQTEATLIEIKHLWQDESNNRQMVMEKGIHKTCRETFELLADDERQCDTCKTTCYLSAVSCDCCSAKMFCCLHLQDNACASQISERTLHYRYTLEELQTLITPLQQRVEEYSVWRETVNKLLDAGLQEDLIDLKEFSSEADAKKKSFADVKLLLVEAKKKQYPKNDLVTHLDELIIDAEKTVNICRNYFLNETRVTRGSNASSKKDSFSGRRITKLSLAEFHNFVRHVVALPVALAETEPMMTLLDNIASFQIEARSLLLSVENSAQSHSKNVDVDQNLLHRLLAFGASVDIELPEYFALRRLEKRLHWLNELRLHCLGLLPELQQLKPLSDHQIVSNHNLEKKKSFSQQTQQIKCDLTPMKVKEEENEVEKKLQRQPLSLEKLKELLEAGCMLEPCVQVERCLLALQELYDRGTAIEERATRILDLRSATAAPTPTGQWNNTTAKPNLSVVLALANEQSLLSHHIRLPQCSLVQNLANRAQEWCVEVEEEQAGLPSSVVSSSGAAAAGGLDTTTSSLYPLLERLEVLLERGRRIPVHLPLMGQLETQVSAARTWRERTIRIFVKKSRPLTLLELLLPRAPSTLQPGYGSTAKDREKLPLSSSSSNAQPKRGAKSAAVAHTREHVKSEGEIDEKILNTKKAFGDPIEAFERMGHNSGDHDMEDKVEAYKAMERRELELILALRRHHLEKAERSTQEASSYCICRRQQPGMMLQCDLCKEWYHAICVQLPRAYRAAGGLAEAALRHLKYLCPLCERSRRPKIDTILALLLALQRLPVRMAEGEALTCLTERAMGWQERAQAALLGSAELRQAFLHTVRALRLPLGDRMLAQVRAALPGVVLAGSGSGSSAGSGLAALPGSRFGIRGGSVEGSGSRSANAETAAAAAMLQLHHARFVGATVAGKQPRKSPLYPRGPIDQRVEPRACAVTDAPLSGSGASGGGLVLPQSSGSTASINSVAVRRGAQAGQAGRNSASSQSSVCQNQATVGQLSPPRRRLRLYLSDKARSALERLMLEGDLIEVTMEETHWIWLMLSACQEADEEDERVAADEESGEEERGGSGGGAVSDDSDTTVSGSGRRGRGLMNKKRRSGGVGSTGSNQVTGGGAPAKRARRCGLKRGGGGGAAVHTANFVSRTNIVQRRRSSQDDTTIDSSDSASSRSPSHSSSPHAPASSSANKATGSGSRGSRGRQIARVKNVNRSLPRRSNENAASRSGAISSAPRRGRGGGRGRIARRSSSDNNPVWNADCDSKQCVQPAGGEINWVQCDSCNKWFHWICIGIVNEEEVSRDDFMCPKCSIKRVGTRKSIAPHESDGVEHENEVDDDEDDELEPPLDTSAEDETLFREEMHDVSVDNEDEAEEFLMHSGDDEVPSSQLSIGRVGDL